MLPIILITGPNVANNTEISLKLKSILSKETDVRYYSSSWIRKCFKDNDYSLEGTKQHISLISNWARINRICERALVICNVDSYNDELRKILNPDIVVYVAGEPEHRFEPPAEFDFTLNKDTKDNVVNEIINSIK